MGLSVDGLHKQMRGTHAISLQTRLLFDGLDKGFEITAIGAEAYAGTELHDSDSPAYRSKMRRRLMQVKRKFGLS